MRTTTTPERRSMATAVASIVLFTAGIAAKAEPVSPQPTLPQPAAEALPMTSPILGGKAASASQPLTVRKPAKRVAARSARRHSHRFDRTDDTYGLDRPALAGVALVQPLPHPIQPPHATVPVPAYPFENAVSFYTTPPPPVVCHHAPRDPDAPDAGLAQQPVICAADNP